MDSLKHFFSAVASDLDKPAADADVVRRAWERIAPGENRGVEGGGDEADADVVRQAWERIAPGENRGGRGEKRGRVVRGAGGGASSTREESVAG